MWALAVLVAASALWVQHPGPVLTATQPWEQVDVQEPSVAFDPATHTFKMWYTGGDEGRCMIGYATSSDGINWVKPLDHPVIGWGYGGVMMNACHSDVQRLNGQWHAWFSVESRAYGSSDGNLYQAVSDDGVTWTPLPHPAVRAFKTGWNTSIANSFVIRDHNRWLMFFDSYGAAGLWLMSTATSTDLVHWKQAASPQTQIGFGTTMGAPWVMRDGHGWTMYFLAAQPLPGVTPWYSQIYEATSPDLAHWATDPAALVTREQPDWQVDQIGDPSVVVADGKRYLFFDGLDNRWPIRSSIGVAISG